MAWVANNLLHWGKWTMKVICDLGAGSGSPSASSSNTGACAKVGVGIDFFLSDHLSLGLEGGTTFGFGNFEFDLDALGGEVEELGIRYWTVTLGAAYHF